MNSNRVVSSMAKQLGGDSGEEGAAEPHHAFRGNFPFRFPPEKPDGQRRKPSDGVPDQPGIEYLLLRSLAYHRRIEPGTDMWMELALSLARDVYPEKKRRGPDQKWSRERRCVLVIEVQRVRVADGSKKSIAWACTQLARRSPWKAFLKGDSGNPAESLRHAYYQSIKNKSLVEEAREKHSAASGARCWDDYVARIVK